MSYLIYLTPFWAKEDACRFGKISEINHAIKNEGLIVILVSLTHSPEQVFDDSVRQRHGRGLLQALDVDFVVHPLHPSGDLSKVHLHTSV